MKKRQLREDQSRSRLRESYLNRLGVKARLQNNGNRGRKEKAISMFT